MRRCFLILVILFTCCSCQQSGKKKRNKKQLEKARLAHEKQLEQIRQAAIAQEKELQQLRDANEKQSKIILEKTKSIKPENNPEIKMSDTAGAETETKDEGSSNSLLYACIAVVGCISAMWVAMLYHRRKKRVKTYESCLSPRDPTVPSNPPPSAASNCYLSPEPQLPTTQQQSNPVSSVFTGRGAAFGCDQGFKKLISNHFARA